MEFTEYEGLQGYNLYNGKRSVRGLVENDITTAYWMRCLYQRVYAGLIPRIPIEWNAQYVKNVLFGIGYIGVIKTPQYGIIPQICAVSGYGLYLQPVDMIVAQPLVSFNGKIGDNCDLIRLTPDWRGIWDIIEHHAIRLSIATTSLDVSLINSRAAIMAAGKNKAANETLKVMYEKLGAGEPLIMFDKALKGEGLENKDDPIWTWAIDVKNNYISDKVLDTIHTILTDFDHEIGIAAIGEKKERMITDEVDNMTADACARSETWFDMLSTTFDQVNNTFPDLNIGFTLKYGGETHEYGEN